MLYTLSNLEGCSLRARDGEIGSVQDFYFDDEAWAIRYLVADTGKWLPGRKVLISPMSLGRVDRNEKHIEVNLTRDQIEKCPPVDTRKPISRQHEVEFYDHYNYPYYWPGPYLWGPVPYPGALPEPTESAQVNKEVRAIKERQRSQDQHLRSAKEVEGYYIEASDGEIGHVEDFLADDQSWAIRYVVVDTRNWWPGKKVVVAPQWIEGVNWQDSKVYVDLPREKIRQAPEYAGDAALTRDYESKLHEHYGRSGYWSERPRRGEPLTEQP
jgi:hypothetical protein